MNSALLLFPLLSAPALAGDLEFQIIGPGVTTAIGLSADGNTVALYGQSQAWTFTEAHGLVSIGSVVGGGAQGISADGTTSVGTIFEGGVQRAAFHTQAGGWQTISTLPAQCDASSTSAYGISGDGSIVVGLEWNGCKAHAMRWEASTGMVVLAQDGPISSRANAVSDNGQLIGGWDNAPFGHRRPALWFPDGSELLLDPVLAGEVWDVSADGTWAVGNLGGKAFRWSSAGGVQLLATLPGGGPSVGRAVSANGKTVVGNSGGRAFLWTESGGTIDLTDYLVARGVTLPAGYYLDSAKVISDDGRVLGGSADNGLFQFKAWLLKLELPLLADVYTVSLATGETQTLTLDAGTAHAGEVYLVAGTMSGTWPGLAFGGVDFPLNLDAYTLYTLTSPSAPPLAGGFGVLDGNGKAQVLFTPPPSTNPALAGSTLHHVFAAFDTLTGQITLASNAEPVTLLP